MTAAPSSSSVLPDWSVSSPGPQDEPIRSLLHGWLREHGIEPADCSYVETAILDIPLVRATVYDLDADGKRYWRVRNQEVATRTVEVPLLRPPPCWSWP